MKLTMKIQINDFLLFFALLLCSNFAQAQVGPCPAGMSEYPGSDGIPSCGPLRQDSDQPRGHWQDQWGAFATSDDGTTGWSSSQLSESIATDGAVSNCISRGGTHCRATSTYKNGCIALVNGDNMGYPSRDATRESAIKSAMKSCKKSGENNCDLFRAECSYAKWVYD